MMTQNHDFLAVKGSQYEILNKEILSDLIDVYIQVCSDYVMGHNYALSGSQKHFHIHIFKKQTDVNYGLDRCIDQLANDIENETAIRLRIMGDTEKYSKKITDLTDEIDYTSYINKSNSDVRIAEFTNKIFGYSGYLITIPKRYIWKATGEDKIAKEKFINVIFNFLNFVENSIEYTFGLYFPSSTQNYSVLVLLQPRKVKSDSSVSVNSFKYITQFVFSPLNTTDRFNREEIANKTLISSRIKIGVFDEEDIFDILNNKPASDGSIYGNNNLRQIIQIPKNYRSRESYNLFTNFTKFIINKPSVPNPKIIIINAPMGSGKSKLYANLKYYYPFFDEKSYVHVNVDDLIMEIPGYKKLFDNTVNFLEINYLNKPFNTYANIRLHKYGDKTIASLKDDNFMHELALSDYDYIYNELLTQILPGYADTIKNAHTTYFNKISAFRNLLLKHISKICVRNNFNLVLENARTTWQMVKSNLNTIVPNDPRVYYLGNYLPSNDFNKKFLLRNVLLRNVKEGRIIDQALATSGGYEAVVKSYKDNVLPSQFISINLGSDVILPKISQVDLSRLKLSKDSTLDTTFDYSKCIDSASLTSKLNLESINNDSGTKSFLSGCLDISKKLGQPPSLKTKLKGLATDLNNKYLLNENTTALLIKNTIKNINESIDLVVKIHNRTSPRKLTTQDIKLILKGGLNIRFLLREFFGTFERNLKLDQIKDLENIIKSLDLTLNYNNLFKNTTSKSDIDFAICINKSKMTEEEYELIRNKLKLLTIRYFIKLRSDLFDTSFYGSESDFIKFSKNQNKLNEVNLKSIQLEPNYCFFIDNPSNYNYTSRPKNTPASTDNYTHLLYAKTSYLEDPTNLTPFVPSMPYYISYQNLHLRPLDKTLDIIRIRNYFKFKLPDDSVHGTGGEIVDLVILDYKSAHDTDFDHIKEVQYLSNMYNFKINVFDESYLMDDLFRMLFRETIFPWENLKLEKRVARFMLFILVNHYKQYLLIGQPASIDFIKLSKDLAQVANKTISIDDLISSNNIRPGHLLYELFIGIRDLINEIDSYQTNPANYNARLNVYGYEQSALDMNKLSLDLCEFLRTVSNGFVQINKLFRLCLDNTTQQIKKELIKTKPIQMVQWGGYQRLYSIYKKYYLELKGGALFDPASKIIKRPDAYNPGLSFITGLGNSHGFTNKQIEYLELLFLQVLPSVSWNGANFTLADIINIIPLSCGTFGCGFKLRHSASGKDFIFKVCGAGFAPLKKNTYLEEVFSGYYTSENQMNMFNKSYGYFSTSQVPSDIYFKSNVPDLKYSGVINNTNATVQSGNIFAIFMSAGSGDLTGLIKSIRSVGFNNRLPANDPTNINSVMNTLLNINKQMFEIGDITRCSKISKQCIYLTHNDIKPPNMIFNLLPNLPASTLNNDYKIEYIDYGAFIFSNTFFNNLKTFTPVMANLVYGRIYNRPYPTSPLFDICSAIYTMFIILTNNANSYSNYDVEFNNLKRFYVTNDLAQIQAEYNRLFAKVATNINTNLFAGTIPTPSTNKNIGYYYYILAQYLNLAMCVYRYHYSKVPQAALYFNLEFKDFELLELSFNLVPGGFVTIGSGQTNNELLQTITNFVKGKVSMGWK